MSWITDIFKGRKEKKQGNKSVAQSFKGYEPKFTDFGKNILASTQILESIRLKSDFVSKVDPKYIREQNGIKVRVTEGSIAKILKRPNKYMTKTDFFYKASFIREVAKNCFIFLDSYETQGGYKKYTGMYILQPTSAEMYEDEFDGSLWWGFEFQGQGGTVFFKKEEIVHWAKNYEELQYKGGGSFTQNSESDMLHTLQGYHQILESIAEASKCACYFDGLLKVNAYTSTDKKTQEIRDKFIEDLRTNRSGVAVLDNGAEWQDINRKLTMVDEKTMEHFQKQIEIYTGVTIDMLRGKFNVEEKEAFYEKNIESGLISLGEAFSMCFFGEWQTTHGDEIILYKRKIELMSTTQVTQIIKDTMVAGIFMKDEYRDMLGYAPLEDGKGQEMPRGYNYLDGATNNVSNNQTTQPSEVKDA
jgi:hypothetical protein